MTTQQPNRAGGEPFDPAAGLFIAQASRPEHLEPLVLAALTPFQRVLLVIDGTVTTFLEAWSQEPVSVARLWQRPAVLAADSPWLAAPAGTPVLDRAVLLTGERTGSFLVYAESVIVPGRLPAAMRRQLEMTPEGLGQILLASGLETRREGLWYGREHLAEIPAEVGEVTEGDFLSRTYRVTAGGHPLMLITERFPWRPVPLGPAA